MVKERTRWFRLGKAWMALACIIAGSATSSAQADGIITITTTKLQEFKGWGLLPAPYDRQMPVYADGSPAYGDAGWLASGATVTPVMDTVLDLGFDIARVYISPTIGKDDTTLDPARMQDFKDHLAILRRRGIGQYIISNWSPPTYMKLPDRVRFGKYQGRNQYLNPVFADGVGYDYADFIVAVLKDLKHSGFSLPLAVSIQNEPAVAQPYDGCVWTDTPTEIRVYRSVVKQLRKKLNTAGYRSVQVLAPEEDGLASVNRMLGEPSAQGFAEMNRDPSFREAVGGFAWHSYATAGTIKDLDRAMSFYGKERWMTEYCTPTGIRGELRAKSGSDQLDWTFNNVRRMAGDIVDLKANYWFFWRGWHSSDQADEQDLVYNGPTKTKSYHVFQKLWQTVKPGWRVNKIRTTEPDLRSDNAGLIQSGSGNQWSAPVDLLAFEKPGGSATCLLLANWTANAKKITALSGLRGRAADIFTTTSDKDMEKQPTRLMADGALEGGLMLPAYSITLLITHH